MHINRFCAERLVSLVRTLELTHMEELSALTQVTQFATLVANYDKGTIDYMDIYYRLLNRIIYRISTDS
jgi:hypothetical protein